MGGEGIDTYLAGLPRTRGAACALLLDSQDRILIVKPTYRSGWILPGGVIETDESPLTACRREMQEELGVSVDLDGLVGIDWIPPRGNRDASNIFVFSGYLQDEALADIHLPPDELSEYRLVPEVELSRTLSERVARRVNACLSVLRLGKAVYLESGTSPVSATPGADHFLVESPG